MTFDYEIRNIGSGNISGANVIRALGVKWGFLFPVWLGFKGGKGVATVPGVLFVLLEWKILLPFLLVWLLVLAISQVPSFSNLLMVSFLPLALWISSFSLAYFILGLALFALIWWAHRENLKRIKDGQEPKIKLKKSTP